MAEIFKPERVAHASFIGPHHAGQSVLSFLCRRFTYFSQEQWLGHIQLNEVLLNGESCSGAETLNEGDEVRYLAMTRPEPKIPLHIPVLFEDEDLLIVNKPPHIPVHPGGRYLRNTLIHLLQRQRKLDFLVLSHRLDRETSGVCVLSKTPLAKDKMYWQFFNGEVEKLYWALVWGRPHPPSGVVDEPIGLASGPGSQTKSRIRIKQAVRGSQAKSARTKYHTLGTRWIEASHWAPPPWPTLEKMMTAGKRGWPVSLVECRPMTGRTNQIRVHLAHLGAGVVGDKLYDPDEEIFVAFKDSPPKISDGRPGKAVVLPEKLLRRLVLDAHALHAKELKLRHPRSGKTLQISAPPPASWHGLYARP